MAKYLAGLSTGIAFETLVTRSVVVTAENLDLSQAYEGDTVVYTATVKDDLAASLPATFVATLKLNGVELITDQVFDAGVYDQPSGLLTLSFTVPAAQGVFDVKLSWDEQEI